MDPYEIEYIAENRIISIIPNFSYDKIYLICGEFGPFRAGLPLNVPLWLAVMLKQKQKCRIVPPDWMEIDNLENIKEEEKNSRFFTKMPNEHYMVEAKLILGVAYEDVPQAAEIKTIIKDIWDIRMSKLRTSMDALMKSGGSYGRLDHLTMMEINSVKPLLPAAMDDLYRIQIEFIITQMTDISMRITEYINKINIMSDRISDKDGKENCTSQLKHIIIQPIRVITKYLEFITDTSITLSTK